MPCLTAYDIYKPYRYRVYELFSLAGQDLDAARKEYSLIRKDFRQEATEREKKDPNDRIAAALRRVLACGRVRASTASEVQLRQWVVDAGVAMSG